MKVDPILMEVLADDLDTKLNGKLRGAKRHTGFILMVYPFHTTKGVASYISNTERDDVINLLRDQLKRLEELPAKEPT